MCYMLEIAGGILLAVAALFVIGLVLSSKAGVLLLLVAVMLAIGAVIYALVGETAVYALGFWVAGVVGLIVWEQWGVRRARK